MGGTVTALEIQKKNKERVSIFLDDEYAFSMMAIDAAHLRKGQTLSDAEIAALKERDQASRAYESALQFLGHRPRSAAEVQRNLTEKEYEPAVIEEAMERLTAQGYIDDAAFVRFWVGNRQEFKPRGARALRFELREKGVSSSVIDEGLAELDSAEAAYRAATDRARRLAGSDKRTFKTKIVAFLARRGFDYGTSRDVIERLIEELETDDPNFFSGQHDDDAIQE